MRNPKSEIRGVGEVSNPAWHEGRCWRTHPRSVNSEGRNSGAVRVFAGEDSVFKQLAAKGPVQPFAAIDFGFWNSDLLWQRRRTGVDGIAPEQLLDAEQLIVLCQTIRAA